MKIEYTTPEIDKIGEAIRQIKKTQATWISRMKNELVVIVRNPHVQDPLRYNWVWVSSHDNGGAYISTTDQTAEQVADTIVKGGWNLQPNLTITLEDLK